jgi:uncharacterized repeat protein (TIGR01451 family)
MTSLTANRRRIAPILGAVLAAGPLVAVLTSAAPAPARPAAAASSFVLHGSAVGRVKVIQIGQTLTFAFTETNTGSGTANEDLVLEKVSDANVTGVPLCVVADGSAINPDGSRCEPGAVAPGQSASFVITTNVTGPSGQAASVRLCLQNEATEAIGPCRTVSVKIA